MPGVAPPAKAPYQMSHEELKELKVQLEELLDARCFDPYNLSSEVLGIPVDSQVPIFGVRESSFHSSKVGL
jgi:hypothetical protein